LYKTELIKKAGSWKSLADAELATTGYVDWFNTRRLHTAIGGIPPAEYEAAYYAQTSPRKRLDPKLKPLRNSGRFTSEEPHPYATQTNQPDAEIILVITSRCTPCDPSGWTP
jgi:hypothetical protein